MILCLSLTAWPYIKAYGEFSVVRGAHKSVLWWGRDGKIGTDRPTCVKGMTSQLAIQMNNSKRCCQPESDSNQHLSPGVLYSRMGIFRHSESKY